VDGAAVAEMPGSTGLPIPPEQLLPFFLAARSAVRPGQDLLGEALCSSFEAFRFTRENRKAAWDEDDAASEPAPDLSHASWYLAEFDHALKRSSGATHPKMHATVRKAVDLWAKGEKVLVFAFYRHTCRALRIHISEEVDRRVTEAARQRLRDASQKHDDEEVERLLETTQRRYFDDAKSPGRRAVDAALAEVLHAREAALEASGFDSEQRDALMDVMRRFLRVRTTLLRFFPIAELDSVDPPDAVRRTLDYTDDSGASWRGKLDRFADFLTAQCTPDERRLYLDAAAGTRTGGIRVEGETEGDASGTPDAPASTVTLANVQVATGDTERETRSRLMRAFNTPFFPDIFVCSEVMGEGVDLQRFCRYVIHHDLAWNPSSIEQRTGRIDRLGCAAEGRHAIVVYLPYLAGTADERQYRVMSDREQWFRVVMGQDEVARLITPDSAGAAALPVAISEGLSFRLDIDR
jgi:ERCC4-related helicase